MFNAIRKDPKNFLLSALLVIAIIAPISALASIGVEHYRQNHRQVGVEKERGARANPNSSIAVSSPTGNAEAQADSVASNNSAAANNSAPSNKSDQIPDDSSLSPDPGAKYQDREGNALDNSHEPPRIIFRDEGSDFRPFVAILVAVVFASTIAYFIGFSSARKRHQRHKSSDE